VKEKPGDTCYFPDEAVYIENGQLVLESNQKAMGGYNYTSGVVSTAAFNASQGFPCHFGYYEANIKSSPGGWEGFCPAFWFPNTVCPPGKNCEIDVEVPGSNCTGNGRDVYFTVEYNSVQLEAHTQCGDQGFCSDHYHTYGVLWQADVVCFYLDNVEELCSRNFIPQTAGWLVFDNEIGLGGNSWAGFPSSSTPFPQKMYVDWVRAWKRNSNKLN